MCQDQSEDDIGHLTGQLGYLPLAISLAAGCLGEAGSKTVASYIRELDDVSTRVELFQFKEAFSDYLESLMSTLEMSMKNFGSEEPF